MKPDLDISANNEEAFRRACYNGHLSVVQWLLQVKPNLDILANYEDSEDSREWEATRAGLEDKIKRRREGG